MRWYRVEHRTTYTYEDDVTASYGRACLVPREAPGQVVHDVEVVVDPQPDVLIDTTDFYGNVSSYLEVHTPHRRLDVLSRSLIEVDRPRTDLVAGGRTPWDALSPAPWPDGEALLARDLLLPSPHVGRDPEVDRYAAGVFTPGRPVGEAVTALVERIHADFAYRPGVTSVATTLSELLVRREGVCQDFAHLAVAVLRSVGLPCRYVSGYLETQPPPGRARLQGADATHAWFSVLLPELGWVDLDPTNDRQVDDDYVVTAWGRDYSDVPPLKGVIFTESESSELTVAVDVLRVPAPH